MENLRRTAIMFLMICGSYFANAQTLLSLEEAFQLADQNNTSIKMFDVAVKAAQESVQVAKTSRLPDLDLSASASLIGNGWISDRDFSNGQNVAMPHFGNNFAIEASQVVYAGGAIESSINLSKLNQQLTVHQRENQRQNVRFMLTGQFLELIKLENQMKVYQENIAQTKRLLDDMRAKENAGIILKNDIIRYELQLQSFELRLVQLNNSRNIINYQMTILLGLDENQKIVPDTSNMQTTPLPGNESEWKQEAIAQSPQLKAAGVGVEMAKEKERLVLAERIPSVVVFAADKLDGPILIEVPTINKNFNYWYVGIGLNYNISSLYKSNRKSKLAKIETLKSNTEKDLLQEHIETQIRQSYTLFEESFLNYSTMQKSLELAQTNYSTINNLYLNDLATITEMLDATNSKLKAELELTNAKVEIFYQYYKLKRSIGTL